MLILLLALLVFSPSPCPAITQGQRVHSSPNGNKENALVLLQRGDCLEQGIPPPSPEAETGAEPPRLSRKVAYHPEFWGIYTP